MKNKNTSTIYPNHHTPDEHRALLMQPLDIALSHQSKINLKKVISLYFTQYLDHDWVKAMQDEGILIENDSITITPSLISKKADNKNNAPTSIKGVLQTMEKDISQSITLVKEVGSNPASQLMGSVNVLELTPELEKRLTGNVDQSYEKRLVNLIQSVTFNNNRTITFQFTPFLKRIRDHLVRQLKSGKSQYSDPDLISINTRELLKFQSIYAAQFYILIAKTQFYSNKLIIDVDELKEYLGWNQVEGRTNNTFNYFSKKLKQIINDDGLKSSTCAIEPVKVGGKIVHWLPAQRDKNRNVTKLEFKFKRNDELKLQLLNKPYPFIKHIKDGLNETVLVQIIARVSDSIIREEWVNYCVNKAYSRNEKSQSNPESKKYKNIGPLVWEYIKNQSFREEYELYPDLCQVADQVGMSISQQQEINRQVQASLPLSSNSKSELSATEKQIWAYLSTLEGFDEVYFLYAQQYISPAHIQKKLKLNESNKLTNAEKVKAIVLNDFHVQFASQIKAYIHSIGFDKRKSEMIYALMEDKHKATLLGFIQEGKLMVPANWKDSFFKYFHGYLADLNS